jgi:predicted phosphoribosyltransferase
MFKDRREAGEKLAERLTAYKDLAEGIVLAIPRGGVVVGRVVADRLGLPLDVLVVRKIGAPGNEELAVGAVGPAVNGGSVVVWDEDLCRQLSISEDWKMKAQERMSDEVVRRIQEYRGNNGSLRVVGKTVVLVDDGIATGATVAAGIKWLKAEGSAKIVLAVPVVAGDTWRKLKTMVDEAVVVEVPEWLAAVGQFYENFGQVSDEEVIRLLRVK